MQPYNCSLSRTQRCHRNDQPLKQIVKEASLADVSASVIPQLTDCGWAVWSAFDVVTMIQKLAAGTGGVGVGGEGGARSGGGGGGRKHKDKPKTEHLFAIKPAVLWDTNTAVR